MNGPVTFNDEIVDLPHHSQIHHLWRINISSDESLIMGLLWNTSSNLTSLMRPPLKNHLAKAWKALEHSCPKLKTPLKTCQSDAGKHPLHRDSNVFPHADTIATFQFQLHLKPPISCCRASDWNMKPCIYTGHYSQYKAPAAARLPGEVRGEETTGIKYSRNTHFYLFIIQ